MVIREAKNKYLPEVSMKMKKGKKKSLFYKICAAMILTGMLPLILINGIWLHNTSNIVYKNEKTAGIITISFVNGTTKI